jgi:hypothetical protein
LLVLRTIHALNLMLAFVDFSFSENICQNRIITMKGV